MVGPALSMSCLPRDSFCPIIGEQTPVDCRYCCTGGAPSTSHSQLSCSTHRYVT